MNERGFSLAELLVACAVLSLILMGVFVLQQQGQVAYTLGAGRVEAQQNARLALDLMSAELRTANPPASATTPMITVTNCNSAGSGTNDIKFYAQNATDTIEYKISGSYLQRIVNTASATASDDYVIGGVVSLNIWCYKSDGTTLTATAADVRSVKIKLTVQTESTQGSSSAAAPQAVVESQVRLRNLL